MFIWRPELASDLVERDRVVPTAQVAWSIPEPESLVEDLWSVRGSWLGMRNLPHLAATFT
ncbi:hypothetical protein DPMN_159653 [Dreissena polymorpha]|uniref:Uncharacterized protein n=1 Tax=Dreissena polymorpha TaxID=45954 RepID=A0A9D4EJF6_DREPO|nr:hypothetical protein DPMN_159653 [Dreissena polymorpha]